MRWYLAKDGQVTGPVDEATIAAWREQGQIQPGTTVCQEGDDHWFPFENTRLALSATAKTSRATGRNVILVLVIGAVLLMCGGLLSLGSRGTDKDKAKAAAANAETRETFTPKPPPAPTAKPIKSEVPNLAKALGAIVKNPDRGRSSIDRTGDTTIIWHYDRLPLTGTENVVFTRKKSNKDAWRFGLENVPCIDVDELGLRVTEISRRPAPINPDYATTWHKIEGGPLDGTFAKMHPMGVNDLYRCSILPGTEAYWALAGEAIGN